MTVRQVAEALHQRYDALRAVTLVGQQMMKALFAGRAEAVLFWALVHAHYRGGDLSDDTERELAVFSDFIERDPSERH